MLVKLEQGAKRGGGVSPVRFASELASEAVRLVRQTGHAVL